MFILWIVLGILSLLYGGFIFAAHSGTRFYMVWFAIAVLCFLFAFLARKKVWSMLPGLAKSLVGILIGLALVVFVVVEGIMVSHFHDRGEPDLDYIVVLGAQVRETGPSVVLKYRLDAAIAYLQENERTLCIVSGGKGPNEPCSEAEGMREYLIANGIAPERILMEDQSRDTKENIRFSAKLMDAENDRIGIITNNFHLFRGIALAKNQGYKHVCGIAAGSRKAYQPNNMLREFLGVMKDFVMGNLT